METRRRADPPQVKMNMNKVLRAATTVAIAAGTFGAPTAAFAENTTSGETNITYTVAESYTWTAPADITFDQNANTNAKAGTFEVTENVISYGKKLSIKIADDEDFKLVDTVSPSNTRDYKVMKEGSELAAGGVVLEVAAGTNTGTQEVSFELQSVGVQKAGTYTGTANFVSSIIDAA